MKPKNGTPVAVGGTQDTPGKAPAPFVPGWADEFLDGLQQEVEESAEQQRAFEGAEQGPAELDREKRILGGILSELDKRLLRIGVELTKAMPDGRGLGWVFEGVWLAPGGVRRPLEVTVRFETGSEQHQRSVESFGRAVCDMTEAAFKKAKTRYVTRML